MIPIGLRTLLGAAAPYFTRAKDAAMGFARANPAKTAVAAAAVPIAAMETADRMHTSPGEAYTAQKGRFLRNVETHKPNDAYDAYAEDDFMRQAFAMSQNYDQYKQMVLAGQYSKAQEEPDVAEELFNGTALTEKEYNAIRNNKRFAKDFVQNGSHRKVMQGFDKQNWGEGWENAVEQDQFRKDAARRRALALQMFQNTEE
ncbi:MAG TPA: hypothetical protein PK317_01765 [Coprothermobacter proteolyticus]|nr:hypothetical protein [Coprothermobacter proteolyticus]